MKKRTVLLILIVLLLGGILLTTDLKDRDNDAKNSLTVISDNTCYSDIILFLENTKKEEGILFEIPKNDSAQDYNTYYGNEILRLLGNENDDSIKKYIDTQVSNDDFLIYKDGDIFESVEKVYYLQKLGKGVDENYHNDKILEIVIKLIENSYDERGFFHYKEFDEHMTDMTGEDIRTMRLHHMMMTLYLCKEYSLLERLDVQTVQKYIKNTIAESSDAINCYYAYFCYVYLNMDTSFFYDKEIIYDKDGLDIIELNAYVSLAKEMGEIIQSEIIVARMNAYVEETCMANMMELFIAIDTLDKLGEPISDREKNRIVSLLGMYRNEDGTFPCISYYVLDNKQLLMHYEMTTRMGLESDITQYRQWLVDDFEEQDYYDLYAYGYFASRLDMNTTELERKLISEVAGCTLDNKSSIGYILLALSELEIDIKKDEYLDKDVIGYMDLIFSSETMEYTVPDLILIYGALKSGIIEVNDNLVRAVMNVDVGQSESMDALIVFYKYAILELAEENINKKGKLINRIELEKQLSTLRCQGGFKMNVKDNFFDLQATYYLIKLIS